MDSRFQGITAIGFDLDQTLYPDDPRIKSAVRNEFYRYISENTDRSYTDAKAAFEEAYARYQESGRAFEECGVKNPREAVRDCLGRVDLRGILGRDQSVIDTLRNLRQKYRLFLITDSRKDNAIAKLHAIGVGTGPFYATIFWDSPGRLGEYRKDDGSAFKYARLVLREPAEHLVYVGNSEKDDILPAKEHGWRTVYVGGKSEAATASIQGIPELEALLL